jgi:hypothetical protein
MNRRTLLQALFSLPLLSQLAPAKADSKLVSLAKTVSQRNNTDDLSGIACHSGCVMVGTLPKCDLGAPVYICDEGHLTLEQDGDRLCVGYVAGKHSDELTAVAITNFVW